MTTTASPTSEPAATTAQKLKAAAPDAGTEYLVLEKNSPAAGESGVRVTYAFCALVTARDTEKAVEKYVADNGNKGGTFVAVPASRWKPVRVTPETVTTLKLEEAK